MIEKLDQAKKDGTHMSNIKSVTNAGDQLIINSPEVNSQDVLKRLELFYDSD